MCRGANFYAHRSAFVHPILIGMCESVLFYTILSTLAYTSGQERSAGFHIHGTSFIHKSNPLSTKNIHLCTFWGFRSRRAAGFPWFSTVYTVDRLDVHVPGRQVNPCLHF